MKRGRKWTSAPVIEEFDNVKDIAKAGKKQNAEENGNSNSDINRENWLILD